MIRHIVILNFHKNKHKDYLSLMEKTRPFVEKIPGILSYRIFFNESKYVAENIDSIGVEILFENNKSLEGFMAHPNHEKANQIFWDFLADPPFMTLTHSFEKKIKNQTQ